MENPAKQRLAKGEFVLCMSLRQFSLADAPLIVQACGFDAFYVDREHSSISARDTAQICISALGLGITPLVRVRDGERSDIATALDGGALGVIVPNVTGREQAEAVVRQAKFPPHGCRSISILAPVTGYRSLPLVDMTQRQNDTTMVIVMLESATAIANVDEIVGTTGVDAAMIGFNDLSADMGIPGETQHPLILKAYSETAAGCRRHGKHLVGGGSGGPPLQEAIAMGARLLMGGSDIGYLISAARQGSAAMRASIASALP